jgi:hypothetical protein
MNTGPGREISRYTVSVKVLVSMDDRLLWRIDRAAREKGMSRSAYLAELAARDLGIAKGSGATKRARGALRRLDGLFARLPHQDAAAAIRAQRDARG